MTLTVIYLIEKFQISSKRTNPTISNIKSSNRLKLIDEELYSLDLASGKGASPWLNALLIKRYNLNLTRSKFFDGLDVGTRTLASKLPVRKTFSISHALHCAEGGYTHERHDTIHDTFANIMHDVCYDVQIEPHLQPLQGKSFDFKTTNTEDQIPLDITENVF